MRIAAFNVENLFDRAKVFNDPDNDAHRDVLDAHANLNKLFEKETYSSADKKRMLGLIEELGMLKRDEGPFTRIRKIRGRLITRPRNKSKPIAIVANGRSDWIGWCELRTSAVDELAMYHTGMMIKDVNADVLAIVEAESRPVLLKFHELMLEKLGQAEGYRHLMIIDGNDQRGIDVGLVSKTGFPIGTMQSHVNDLKDDGFPIFSRDCPEYEITTPSGETIWVLPNHFKSKFGGNSPSSKRKRLAQSKAVAEYYSRLRSEGFNNIVVLGDLNDTRDSEELAPLIQDTDLRDADEHPQFTDFEFNTNNGSRGIGTHKLGNDKDKIDYLLLSPALFDKVTAGGLFRKGIWPGARARWETYPTLKHDHQAASDHHLIWVDIDI